MKKQLMASLLAALMFVSVPFVTCTIGVCQTQETGINSPSTLDGRRSVRKKKSLRNDGGMKAKDGEGANETLPSQDEGKQPTAMMVSPTTGYPGWKVSLEAALYKTSGRNPALGGRRVNFYVGSAGRLWYVGHARTDPRGRAVFNYVISPNSDLGRFRVKAEFVGDERFEPSSAMASLQVANPWR
jgi:hypothetical protein